MGSSLVSSKIFYNFDIPSPCDRFLIVAGIVLTVSAGFLVTLSK